MLTRDTEAQRERTPKSLVAPPPFRRLRGYSYDPSLASQLARTASAGPIATTGIRPCRRFPDPADPRDLLHDRRKTGEPLAANLCESG
jgi:hypothetical protein